MGLLKSIFNALQSILCGSGGRPNIDESGPVHQPQQPQVYQVRPPQKQTYPPQQQQRPTQSQSHATHQTSHRPTGSASSSRPKPQASHPNKENLPPSRPPAVAHKPLNQRYDDNLVNQQNEHYRSLRARAHAEGDAMGKCFRESQEAYRAGEGAKAKELSNEGKRHQAEMERLNDEASTWIFRENNLDSAPDEIDLHGLYVKEAIEKTDEAILAAQRRGDRRIRIIVGKGLHSQGSVAKIKPAIEELMVKHKLAAALDPDNAGVLIVELDHKGGMSSDEVAKRLEDDRCSIM